MKPRPDPTLRPGYGEIRADALYPLREVGRRLALGNRSLAQIQRDGLRAVAYGRLKYVQGADVLAFFDRLAQQQTAQPAGEAQR